MIKCFIISLSSTLKYVFSIIPRVVKQHVSFDNKGYFVSAYLRYKKVFLDENPKTSFSDMKKKIYIYINVLHKSCPEWFSINYWSYLFHEDVVIHQRTLMFSTNYLVRTGFVVSDTPQSTGRKFRKQNMFTGDRWQMTGDRWHMKCHIWHVTHELWHVKHDTWHMKHGHVFIIS